MSIINGLLDTDMYKLTMAQFVHRYYPNIEVTYRFKNRNDGPLFFDIEDLNHEVELFKYSFLSTDELEWLKNLTVSSFFNPEPEYVFSNEFINYLSVIDLSDVKVNIEGPDDITVTGPWEKSIFFETPMLAMISELRSSSFEKQLSVKALEQVAALNVEKVQEAIESIENERSLRFSDFGTRRRFSFDHHDRVLKMISESVDSYHLSGTSNLYFAKKYNLRPVGTFAHELPMVIAGLCHDPRDAYLILMDKWKKMYGKTLNILLPDTFSSDWLFYNHGREVVKWEGVRQDSGDPYEFTEKYIKLLNLHGIDPMERVIVFSDGLDFSKMKSILEYCRGRVWATFGIGTNFTHNTSLSAPNIVMKADSVRYGKSVKLHKGLVKLSDEKGKYTGGSEDIKNYKRMFLCY